MYEVCGQVVRSGHWFFDNIRLRDKLLYRTRTGSEFVVGDRPALEPLFERISAMQSRYRVILVQPGVSKAKMTEPVQHILAAADDYVLRANGSGDLSRPFWSPGSGSPRRLPIPAQQLQAAIGDDRQGGLGLGHDGSSLVQGRQVKLATGSRRPRAAGGSWRARQLDTGGQPLDGG